MAVGGCRYGCAGIQQGEGGRSRPEAECWFPQLVANQRAAVSAVCACSAPAFICRRIATRVQLLGAFMAALRHLWRRAHRRKTRVLPRRTCDVFDVIEVQRVKVGWRAASAEAALQANLRTPTIRVALLKVPWHNWIGRQCKSAFTNECTGVQARGGGLLPARYAASCRPVVPTAKSASCNQFTGVQFPVLIVVDTNPYMLMTARAIQRLCWQAGGQGNWLAGTARAHGSRAEGQAAVDKQAHGRGSTKSASRSVRA